MNLKMNLLNKKLLDKEKLNLNLKDFEIKNLS